MQIEPASMYMQHINSQEPNIMSFKTTIISRLQVRPTSIDLQVILTDFDFQTAPTGIDFETAPTDIDLQTTPTAIVSCMDAHTELQVSMHFGDEFHQRRFMATNNNRFSEWNISTVEFI